MTGGPVIVSVRARLVEEGGKFREEWTSYVMDETRQVIYESPVCDNESLARYGAFLYCKLNQYKIKKIN